MESSKMTTEELIAHEDETAKRHLAIAKTLNERLSMVGWKVASTYLAKRGSVYCKVECIADGGTYKLRIADHEETSDSHVHAEFTLLVGDEWQSESEIDYAALVAAIVKGETGYF
jgi:hypothetical protein